MGAEATLPGDGGFDRDWSLDELLPPERRLRIEAALAPLIGPCRLRGPRDPQSPGSGRAPVRHEIETIGWLEGEAEPPLLGSAAALVEQLLASEARYRMAASLHLETVRSDYEELKRRHEALAQSEGRYRELAAGLEQRVAEQVRTIDGTRRKLYQSEKMAAVGQLAAGLAHEINNPIGFIRSNLGTAAGYLAELERALRTSGAVAPGSETEFVLSDFAQLLRESVEGADRIRHIVADLKDFAGVDVDTVAPADLNEVIAKAVEVGKARLAGASVTLDLRPLPRTVCHAANLGQVVLHLLSNAADAAGQGGKVRVATGMREGAIAIAVSDNGAGMDGDTLARIFDPFFTTKQVGQGSGLGLTVSNDIVRAHGGHIEVESRPGVGSRFTVHLPVQ